MHDDSHVMSSIISSENDIEHALKMLSASCDWQFKEGLNMLVIHLAEKTWDVSRAQIPMLVKC